MVGTCMNSDSRNVTVFRFSHVRSGSANDGVKRHVNLDIG
jgi:hypothetical protein